MMQRLSLLLLLVCVATTTAIETHMGKRYHPFDSPLSAYGNYQGQKDDDKKMVSNRRKADAIVDARLEKMKNIAMKKRAREIKREQGEFVS